MAMKRSQRVAAGQRGGYNGDDYSDDDDMRRPQRQSARRASRVDFSKCEVSSLHKYRKFHKLEGSATTSKDELIAIVTKHFASQAAPPDDEAIVAFLMRLKITAKTQGKFMPHTFGMKRGGRGGGGAAKAMR